jgi:ATP-dependent Clp protease adapter protein ClpS
MRSAPGSPEVLPVSSPETDEEELMGFPWSVLLFNDDVHGFEEVIRQVQKATGCSYSRAEEITLEAHTNGQAVCYTGELDACKTVARILEEIHLLTEIVKAGGE